MRACFLGQNVCALGFGVALIQSPPADPPATPREAGAAAPNRAPNPMPNPMFAALGRPTIYRQPDLKVTHS